jgi:hypothetical protein
MVVDVLGRGTRLLAATRELIVSAWTQHAEARDAAGVPVAPWDPEARSWSLLGALVATYERGVWVDDESTAIAELAAGCHLLAAVVDSDSLTDWNDARGRTQSEVIRAIDEASALGSD